MEVKTVGPAAAGALEACAVSCIALVIMTCQVMGTHRETFLHGNEGEGLGMGHAASEQTLAALWAASDGEDAVQMMYDAVRAHPGRVTIVAIGMVRCTRLRAAWHGMQALRLFVCLGGYCMGQAGSRAPALSPFEHCVVTRWGRQPTWPCARRATRTSSS